MGESNWRVASNPARRAARVAAIVSAALIGAVLPAAAQQATAAPPPRPEASAPVSDQRDPMIIAAGVNMRRSELYQQRDTAAAASLYTEGATYIELLPILQVLKGRDQIRDHFEELIDAAAVTIVPTVRKAERNPDGTLLVSGDYLVVSKDGTEIAGHFVQTLRQEDGAWRIAMHIFARPDPVTAREVDPYPRD